jgi:hypothetical protein
MEKSPCIPLYKRGRQEGDSPVAPTPRPEAPIMAGWKACPTKPKPCRLMQYSLEFLGRGPGNTFLHKKGFPGKLLQKLFRASDFFQFVEGFIHEDKEHRLALAFDPRLF